MILIQCTKSKRDSRAKARNLYDESQYFRAMRSYAKATGESWYIISARFGLLDPDAEINPYDAFGIDEALAQNIAKQVQAKDPDTVTIIAGRKYTNNLIPELEKRGIDVVELCAGESIGERMQTLNMKKRQLVNETLC